MRLGYVLLYVPDVAATVTFYEAAFGLARRFVAEGGDYAEMETGGTALGFVAEELAESGAMPVRRNRPDEAPAAAEIAFVTGDVAASVERAIRAGAVLAAAPKTKPWGQTVAYVRDLDGFLVEICTPMG